MASCACFLVPTNSRDWPLSDRCAHEVVGLLQLLDGLLQVDDIDAVALRVDVGSHLGVPAAGLMTEVDACLRAGLSWIRRLPLLVVSPSNLVLPPEPSSPLPTFGTDRKSGTPCGIPEHYTVHYYRLQALFPRKCLFPAHFLKFPRGTAGCEEILNIFHFPHPALAFLNNFFDNKKSSCAS